MKNLLIVFTFLFCWGTLNVQGQTALEKAVKEINVSINMPPYLQASKNKKIISSIIPRLKQKTRNDKGVNEAFGKIYSILEHTNGEYMVFVYVSPDGNTGKYGEIITDSTELYTLANLQLDRIKKDFRYGLPDADASEWEAHELYSMLTHYPREQAQEMFNANAMVMYPLNLRGVTYKDKYTRSRAVVIAKDGREIYLYFLMTDGNIKNFDTYLKDLNKVFWFND